MEGIKLIAPLVIIIAVISFIAFVSLNSFATFKEPMDNTSLEYNVTDTATDIINVIPQNTTIITWVGITAVILSILAGIYVYFTRLNL